MSHTSVGILLLTPFWCFLFHAISTRTSWGIALPRQILTLFCCLFTVVAVSVAIGVVDFFLVQAGGDQLPFVTCVALLFVHVYFHLFNMSETARRIRLLIMVQRGEELTKVAYDDLSMVRVRIERLKDLGQIQEKHGKLLAKKTWFSLACRLVRWQEAILFPHRFTKRRITTAWIREPA